MKKKIICNCCGKMIGLEEELIQEDYLHIEKEWGYFSKKDGMLLTLNVCEECFDQWSSQFKVPIAPAQVTEFV